MKQRTMVLAVAGALAAPGLALAQASNVQLYGRLDVRVDSMKYDDASSAKTAGINAATLYQSGDVTKQHIHTSNNYIGFRGTEDLGGGLSAFFQLEAGLDVDGRKQENSGFGGSFGGRDSFLGLRGSWGQIRGGNMGTAAKDVDAFWNVQPSGALAGMQGPSGDSTGALPTPNCTSVVNPVTGNVTPTSAVICNSEIKGNSTSFHRRQSDFVEYTSPNLSGFVVRFGKAFADYEEPASATPAGSPRNNPDLWSTSVAWTGGPFAAVAAYEYHKGFRATNSTGTDRDAKDDAWFLAGKWDFGVGAVGLGYAQYKFGNSQLTSGGTIATNTPGAVAVGTGDNSFKTSAWTLTGLWRVTGNDLVGAGYAKLNEFKDCGSALVSSGGASATGAYVGAGCGSETESKAYSISYDHLLSKRSAIYAAYSKIDNSAAQSVYFNLDPTTGSGGGGRSNLQAGQDVSRWMVGVKHTF